MDKKNKELNCKVFRKFDKNFEKFKNNLQQFLNLFFFSKKIFTKPDKSKILIIDSDHSKLISFYFPKHKVHILDVRYKEQKGQKINVFIILKLFFFLNLILIIILKNTLGMFCLK